MQVAEIIKELRKPAASSLRNCAAAAAFAKLLVEPQMKADRALEVRVYVLHLNLFCRLLHSALRYCKAQCCGHASMLGFSTRTGMVLFHAASLFQF